MHKLMDIPFDSILMDGINDLVFVISVHENQFNYVFLNRVAMNQTGLDESILGKSIYDVNTYDMATFLNEQYTLVVTNQSSLTYEDTYISVHGQKHYAETKLTPLFDQNKKITHIVAVVKDITKQKLANQTLKHLNEIKEKYESLLNHNADAVLSFDLDGHIIYGNKLVKKITGYDPHELIGTTFNSLVIPEDINHMNKLFQQAINGTIEPQQLAIIHKNGKRTELFFKLTPVIVGGETKHIYGFFRDITKKVHITKKLTEKEEQFRMITEHANDLITLINHKGEIIYVSPSYKKILGFEHDEYIGKLFLHNLHPDDRMQVNQKVIESIKNRRHFNITFRQYNHENKPIWCNSHGSPVFDDRQQFKHMVVVTRDISLQKEYEEKLKYFAFHDPLTGLLNRRLFNEHLIRALKNLQKKDVTLNCGFANELVNLSDEASGGQSNVGHLDDRLIDESNETDRCLYDKLADADGLEDDDRSGRKLQGTEERIEGTCGSDSPDRPNRFLYDKLADADDLEDDDRSGGELQGTVERIEGTCESDGEDDNHLKDRLDGKLHDIDDLLDNDLKDTGGHLNEELVNEYKDSLNDKLSNSLAVMMLDIDHFKHINDQMGHDVGDKAIEEFAKRLVHSVHQKDIVARLGGDEFVILLTNIESVDSVLKTIYNIQTTIKQPWNINGHSLKVTTSIGIAIVSSFDETPSAILKRADQALYQAKSNGGNGYQMNL